MCMCLPAAPHKCVHRWGRAVCELMIDARWRLVLSFKKRYINGCLCVRPAAGAICANISKILSFQGANVDIKMFYFISSEVLLIPERR